MSPAMHHFVYILPVHNEALVLEANTRRVCDYLSRIGGGTILLVENGSSDASFEIAEELAGQHGSVRTHSFREPTAGIGYAYNRGLREALALFGPDPHKWAILTAADLPFGFTDVEQVDALVADEPAREPTGAAGAPPREQAGAAALGRAERMFIGSKAHPESRAETGAKRRLMSAVYRAARFGVLGMRVDDSQGSVFLRLDLAAQLVGRVHSRGFFYSTELCHFAETAGERIVEVPVILEKELRGSTVRAWKHGTEMARQLLELRWRS